MSFSVVGIGEVLWDLLPTGPQLGGAPGNFACHARALGANASVVTRVGKDDLGRRILERFEKMSLSSNTIQVDPLAPTGTAGVTLDQVGIPRFLVQENVAWDGLVLTPYLLDLFRNTHAICFGSLAQRNPVSRKTIQRLLAAAPAEALRVFDINLRDRFYSREIIQQSLGLANVLKLNSDELVVLADMFSVPGSLRKQIQRLADMFQLRIIALTCGEKRSLLYAEGVWSEQIPAPTPVVDTVGAGDSFTAALVIGLLARMPLEEIHSFANAVAGFVCSQPGATPALPQSLRGKCQILAMLHSPRQSGFLSRSNT
jgi:fructokinase